MKRVILRISAWLSLIGGIVLAINTLRLGGGSVAIFAIAYSLSGMVVWALFSTVADIAQQLENGFAIQQP